MGLLCLNNDDLTWTTCNYEVQKQMLVERRKNVFFHDYKVHVYDTNIVKPLYNNIILGTEESCREEDIMDR